MHCEEKNGRINGLIDSLGVPFDFSRRLFRKVAKLGIKSNYFRIVTEILFIILVILWMTNVMNKRIYLILYEPDEAAWIYSGYYFNLYFLKFDLLHKDWIDYDAYDHPPLVKYIVGGALFLKGYVFNSLEAKKMWNSIPMNKYASNYGLLISKIPNPTIVIPFTRSVIFVFAFLSLLLIYFFVRSFYGMLPAIVSTSLLMTNFIFIGLSTQILADPILLFFFIFFVLICSLYLKSGNNIFIFFCFVLSSFAFLTKLNGLILIFVLFFIILVKNRFRISNYNFKIIIFGFIIFLMVIILLNPFFINSGIHGIVKMIEHRVSHIQFQQETFKADALLSMGERFHAEIEMIFFKVSFLNKQIGFPFELILFLLGIYYSVRKRDIILLIMIIFFILPIISILPLNWNRYYYTVIPFIYIIAGVSLNIFKELKK